MARFNSPIFHFTILFFTFLPLVQASAIDGGDFSIRDSDSDFNIFHQDYSPPAPPPPPPHPPSVSCTDDLDGIGDLDATCQIVNDLNLTRDVYISGKGNFYILPGVRFHCPIPGCSITVNITGNFSLGTNSSIVTGALELASHNASFLNGSVVNTTGLAGNPPPETSGTPQGVSGAGGGHGGRGACCFLDDTKLPEDVWGGDAYSWSSLQKPCSFGSRGGTTSKEAEYGGLGGGKVSMDVVGTVVVEGSILADGGDGGTKGGGGSGGSIHIIAYKMTGSGRISACGGNGYGGGGGGRVSVNVFSRHYDPEIFVHGGSSFGCPKNAGAAGTLYDAVPRSLIVSNHNMSTDTETLLLEFPNQPLWTNVYIENNARASVPLLWSRVQVEGQISLLCGGKLSFGLAHYASSEFELLAEELLMSDSEIKVYGALRMSVKIFLMWNSTMLIDGGEDVILATSLLEASNLIVLKKSSVIHSNANLGVHGQGLLNLSGPGNLIEAQRCTGGVGRGRVLNNSVGSGGGHGGKGGLGCYNGSCVEGGISYGNANLPCELGSGSGDESLADSTAGGGIIVMGSFEHPLSSLSIEGSVSADGEDSEETSGKANYAVANSSNGGPGGGSGGTILLFLQTIALGEAAILSSVGGFSSPTGAGGGGGGRIHFHWSDIPTGDVYQPIATVKGSIHARGGKGAHQGGAGENGTLTGKACPKGLYGIFCEECPAGTYKNVTGSDRALCHHCPAQELPHRAEYIAVRGGIAETPCPYKCVSDRYHMPNCYTALEELIYTFGGPWLFGLLLIVLLVLLALVLSAARMKFVGVDELPGPAPTQHGSQIDHSFPFLESLNEVLETNRAEESQSHVHRMYFMGPNTFSEPWHLPHTPPEQIKEIVYEGAFNTFVDEINAIAAYQWWEGAAYSILSVLGYPLAWSWQQWRRKLKLQRLREFVRSEYDHACLRSCRSRALYEGIKVAATSDLMLAYVDFFLGGDEKRTDLPPRLHQRFPMLLPFGGDGSYMAPFSLHSDNILTSLMSQSVPPTKWYRLVAGLNAQLRLVRRSRLRATACGYFQYGLLVYAIEEENNPVSLGYIGGALPTEQQSRENPPSSHLREETHLNQAHGSNESLLRRRRIFGSILDANSVQEIEEKREIFYLLSFILHNTKPVGHQDLVGLVISMLLLGDFSLVLLTLLQLYSFSLLDVFLVLFILPLGVLLPFPAGINALFSHGPRRSAGLARVYALWNITSLINVVIAFLCGYFHHNAPSPPLPNFQTWNVGMDESEWWIFPAGLVLCKFFQSQLINWHVANLEIQDRSLYSNNFDMFWH
nr:hypothetical protein CFP56_41805 [Quercus suber]